MDFFKLAVVLGVSSIGFSALGSSTASASVSTLNENDLLVLSQAGLGARDRSVGDVSAPNVRRVAQVALNTLVGQGVQALRENGNTAEANAYEKDWDRQYSSYLTGLSADDLGDHKPLSRWLANFYDKLEIRLSGAIIHQGLIGDIWDMNYALPVVFSPKGDWRQATVADRQWVEYRKHFIPFANVITYYGVSIACNRIVAQQGMGKQGKKLCTKVAEKLRHAMGRYLAPKISDFIFNRSNGSSARLELTTADFHYADAQTLASEIAADLANEPAEESPEN